MQLLCPNTGADTRVGCIEQQGVYVSNIEPSNVQYDFKTGFLSLFQLWSIIWSIYLKGFALLS